MDALTYARRHTGRFVDELCDLVRIPTVSAEPRRAPEMQRCARRLVTRLADAGLDHARTIEPSSGAAPLVTADWLHAPGAPTALIYGHYDVQPADEPGWTHPPFSPVVVGHNLYGRGASDDKGQLFAHVKALESLLATRGALPVNVRVVLEGEEEIGSAGLLALIARRPALFAADVAVISDMPIIAPDCPAITYAMRGSVSVTVIVSRAGGPLHSGMFGGAVADPLWAACQIVARLRGADGRITLPGFYDRVRPVDAGERAALAHVAAVGGGPAAAAPDAPDDATTERDFSAAERTTIRPSLTITGLRGGYQGPGEKTVIGTEAAIKINLRLVADQDPDWVLQALRRHVGTHTPPGLSARVRVGACARPVMVDRNHPAIAAAARAYQCAFGRPPLFRRSSGSLPVAAAFKHQLGIEPLLLGLALPDDRAHGPDERMHLSMFTRGIALSIALLDQLAALYPHLHVHGTTKRGHHDHRLSLPRG
jgi:acetylornithine deacetylase/succinyl-diaminopimelate desuccinylase-like protein